MIGIKLRCAMAASILALCGAVPDRAAALDAERLQAFVTPFSQALAAAASDDAAIGAFYRETGYAPLWTGGEAIHQDRLSALIDALGNADLHGLPSGRYDPEAVRRRLASIRSTADRATADVELTRMLLSFASDLSVGILAPSAVVPANKREARTMDRADLIRRFADASPMAFLADLPPRSREYGRLVREKTVLTEVIASGGWGPVVTAGRLGAGDVGPQVVALRDRLTAMGYLGRSPTGRFDDAMTAAVRAFQDDHGIEPDGIVRGTTLRQVNADPVERMGRILVAMERERWLNLEPEERHIWVNLTDFRSRIVVDGETVFETKSVIGRDLPTHETPEFSDVMDHMVINPYWYVPRSIIVSEYLPGLQSNPNAHSHLEVFDQSGQTVSRGRGFSQYTARTFPFSMRQPPGPGNALGRVKFMFPNQYNIYLHDTPSQHLFSEEVRAFSHGCIRLDDPYEFAHALLELQGEADPEGFFQSRLVTGREARVNLEQPLPVHLVYRTAISKPEGGMAYRDDVYGRDAAILEALRAAGVALPSVEG